MSAPRWGCSPCSTPGPSSCTTTRMSTAWGTGPQAVLDYLARYLFRVAITNHRIIALDAEAVTLRYKKRQSNRLRSCRIEGGEFMRRFLSHVLPKGLHKGPLFRPLAPIQTRGRPASAPALRARAA